MKIGSDTIGSLYLGSEKIGKAYLGTELLYESVIVYEEYPYHFKIVVNCTTPNQLFNIGYNINGNNCYSVIFDGVDVTSNKDNYITGGNPTSLKCPTVGEHIVYLQVANWNGGLYLQLMNNMRLRKDCQIQIRTNVYGSSIQYVDSLSMTPPPINANDALPNSIVQIRVPIGAKAAYVAADKWKAAASKIVEYNFHINS